MLDLVISWRNSLKETYSYQDNSDPEQPFFSSQTDFNHADLKLQTLQLWQDQQQKLVSPLPSNTDLYQVMRQDHPLGIDDFVSQTCQLSPHVNPI